MPGRLALRRDGEKGRDLYRDFFAISHAGRNLFNYGALHPPIAVRCVEADFLSVTARKMTLLIDFSHVNDCYSLMPLFNRIPSSSNNCPHSR